MKNIYEFLSQNYNPITAYGALILTGVAQIIAFINLRKKEPVSKEKDLPQRLATIDVLRLAIEAGDELKAQEIFTHLYNYNLTYEKLKVVMSLQDPYSAIRWLKVVEPEIIIENGRFKHIKDTTGLEKKVERKLNISSVFTTALLFLIVILWGFPSLVLDMPWYIIYLPVVLSAVSFLLISDYRYHRNLLYLLELRPHNQQQNSLSKKSSCTLILALKKLFRG